MLITQNHLGDGTVRDKYHSRLYRH
jgi:hypothetical protein